eukprot:scaffold142327_cov19-Tisochrysis_lutea.AAC.1
MLVSRTVTLHSVQASEESSMTDQKGVYGTIPLPCLCLQVKFTVQHDPGQSEGRNSVCQCLLRSTASLFTSSSAYAVAAAATAAAALVLCCGSSTREALHSVTCHQC